MSELTTTVQTTEKRSISETTTSLIELLQSHNSVAFVVGVKQGRTVKGWAESKTQPSDPSMTRRLEVADNLARIVQEEGCPWVSRSWLISCNPHLEYDAPMDRIQALNGTSDDVTVISSLQVAADRFTTS